MCQRQIPATVQAAGKPANTRRRGSNWRRRRSGRKDNRKVPIWRRNVRSQGGRVSSMNTNVKPHSDETATSSGVKYCFHTVLLSGLFCCCFFNSRSAVFWAWPWGPGNGSADWGSSQGIWWKLSSSRQSSEHQLLWKPNHIFPGSQWSWKDHNHVSENNFSSCSWVQYKLFLNTENVKRLLKNVT